MANSILQQYVWQSANINAKFTVEFPKSPNLELIAISADLVQGMEQHDLLNIYFKGKPAKLETSILSGDPVTFTYTNNKVTSTFKGYVHHISQNNNIHGAASTTVTCISASHVLKDTAQKIYKNVTADQVISQACSVHSLAAVTQRHPRVRNAIVQAGQTYWQLFRSLAREIGFTLRAENTTIIFVSRDKYFNDKKSNAPYFNYIDSTVNGVLSTPERALGSIIDFVPIVSDESPETGIKTDRVVSGQNRVTKASIKTTTPHSIPKSNQGAVVPNEDYFLS